MTASLRDSTPAWLRVLAVVSIVAVPGIVLAVAGSTFGYDFAAYRSAAERLLAGQPLYDANVSTAGGYAIFLYPPPSILLFVPFAWLPWLAAVWLWTGALFTCVVASVALMPVAPRTRWIMLLLAGLSWPVAYSLKLGQVGPVLLLLFVLAWRALDRPGFVGMAAALGGLLKVQPFALLGWALLTGRLRAVVIGIAAVAAAVLVTLPLVGPASYQEYLDLLRKVSDAVTTPNNVAPGAVAYQLGAPAGVAGTVQAVTVVLVVLVVLIAIRRSPTVGLIATAVASQLVSPLLWDHYAIVLLLPVAFLLERGHPWAAAIPLILSTPLVVVVPATVVPLAFVVCLVAPVIVEHARDGLGVSSRMAPVR